MALRSCQIRISSIQSHKIRVCITRKIILDASNWVNKINVVSLICVGRMERDIQL